MTSPDPIAMLTGYQPAAALTAAHRVGLLAALADGPLSAGGVADRLGLSPGPTEALLASLAALDVLQADVDGYRLAPDLADQVLGEGFGLVVEKEAVFARVWLDLADTLRDGDPRLAPWAVRLAEEPDGALAFLEALEELAVRTAPPLARLPQLAGRRVVDVGGGLGHHSRRLAAAGSVVTLVDLPVVAGWARARLDGVEGVTVVAVDVLADPACGVVPGSMEAALVSHLLHDLPVADALAVLRGAVAAVQPGGWVVVSDFAGDVGPGGFGPLFDVMMTVETGGRAHALGTLVEMMTRAGLVDVRRMPPGDPATVLAGRRP